MSETLWFVFGILFLIGEIAGRGYLLLSLGFSAIVTGLISVRLPNPYLQVILFAIQTAILFAFMRKFAIRFFTERLTRKGE